MQWDTFISFPNFHANSTTTLLTRMQAYEIRAQIPRLCYQTDIK